MESGANIKGDEDGDDDGNDNEEEEDDDDEDNDDEDEENEYIPAHERVTETAYTASAPAPARHYQPSIVQQSVRKYINL